MKPVYGVVVTSAGVGTVHCSSGIVPAIAAVGKEVRANAIAANAVRRRAFFMLSRLSFCNLLDIWLR